MRKLIASLIVLSPVLLHAQASKAVDVLKMFMPAAAAPAASLTTTTATPAAPRISTGISAAKLVRTPTIPFTAAELRNDDDNRVVVRMLVNENGIPQEATIVKSLNPLMDARVLAAVREARFRPAVLDAQTVAEHVNLTFVFQR